MRSLPGVLVALALVLLAGCRLAGDEPVPAVQALLEEPPAHFVQAVREALAPILDPAPSQTRFPGVVVGVLQGGRCHVLAFGEIVSGAAVDPAPGVDAAEARANRAARTLFPVASLTKPVSALLLARMVARGDLALDAPAVACDLQPNLCPEGRPITWRNLATHTSGLPVLPDDVAAPGAYTSQRWQAFLSRAQLRRAPGSAFEYSTVGYSLLGAGLARRADASFAQAVTDEILMPLGMQDSRFTPSAEDLQRLALGHRSDGTPAPWTSGTEVFAPSGGLITTVADLLAFLRAHLQPEPAWGPAIDLLLEIHAEIPSYPPSVMALGWQCLQPAGFYWHAGSGGGHHGFMTFHRSGRVAVVVLTTAATDHADARLAVASFALLGRLLQESGA